jgi:hypothetical protein
MAIKLARLEEQNKTQTRDISEIHKAIIGNGKPGLRTEMDEVKGSLKTLKYVGLMVTTAISLGISAIALWLA